MTGRECERLAKRYLVPQLACFGASKRLVFREPIGELFSGFLFNPSGYDRVHFAIFALVFPCSVPTEHVALTFGREIGHWDYHRDTEEQMMFEVLEPVKNTLPFLESVSSAESFAVKAPEIAGNGDDPYVLQAVAYAHARAGHYQAALEGLEKLRWLASSTYGKESWARDMLARACELSESLRQGSVEVDRLMDKWRRTTLVNLGLGKYECA